MNQDNIETIYPDMISSDQENWNMTAEGILRRILWQIETGQVKPKEMVIVFMDRKDGGNVLRIENTEDNPLKINGLLHLALSRNSDSILYGDRI